MKKGYQPPSLHGISKLSSHPDFANRLSQDLSKNTDSLYNVKREGTYPLKLKRVLIDRIAVLQVTEGYSPQDLAVLRAGVNQMTTTGKDKLVIVDVTNAKPSTPSIASELNSLQGLAAENEAALLIAGPDHAELGGSTLEIARKKMLSPEFRASLEEIFLNARVNKLERMKTELEARTKDSDKREAEMMALRKKNTELQLLHKALLLQGRGLLADLQLLHDPSPDKQVTSTTLSELKRVRDTIRPILDQLGVAKP